MNIALNQIETMSSREISTLCQREHKNVLRVIDQAIDEKILAAQFEPSKYIVRGKEYREYFLNKKDSMYVVARISPEFTMAIVDRWQELENNQALLPQTLPEALRLAADLAEEKAALEIKVANDAPKVEFVDQYVSFGESKCFRDVAAILGVKQSYFSKMLMAKNIVYKKGGDYKAYADYDHYFEVKQGIANDREYSQLRINNEGVIYLTKRFGSPELNANGALESSH